MKMRDHENSDEFSETILEMVVAAAAVRRPSSRPNNNHELGRRFGTYDLSRFLIHLHSNPPEQLKTPPFQRTGA